MANLFTVAISNPLNLIPDLVPLIRQGTEFALATLARYLDWNGSMDVEVRIRAATDPQHPYPQVDGILPAYPAVTFDDTGQGNLVTLQEAVTGIDANGTTADAAFTIFLGADGTMRNYGFPVWLDPAPQQDVTPDLPAGHHDYASIALHELLHTFGFYYWPAARTEFVRQTQTIDGVTYFLGENVKALLGPLGLPLSAGNTDHYGNSTIDYQPVTRGIMYQFGNYEQNRWELGRLDLAVLKDLGWTVRTMDGLALVDLDDRMPWVTGTDRSERLYGDFHDNRLEGGAGNDTLYGAAGNDTLIGGEGVDVALFSGGVFIRGADGAITVTGPDGTDRVEGVEVLILDGQTFFTSPAGRPLSGDPVDEAMYLAANPDVAAAVAAGALPDGATHWHSWGRLEGRAPNLLFDAAYYAGRNADLRAAFGDDSAQLLNHWLLMGIHEGRRGSSFFDPAAYLALNPDVAAAGVNPMVHYLAYGIMEGRAIGADMDWFA